MENRWDPKEAAQYANNPLAMRVYSSRLLGEEESLVLHGGGNTSVKAHERTLFGIEEILYVKGSGWDLATIKEQGFAPVKRDALLKMAELHELSDTDMKKYQRAAMIDPTAPNPSVEAILHAVLPYTFVDHTHADAVVIISNTPNGEERLSQVYGDKVLVLPYVMPGFTLAQQVAQVVKERPKEELDNLDAIVLMHHGIFTFADNAQESYEKMIQVVSQAEEYLRETTYNTVGRSTPDMWSEEMKREPDLIRLAQTRKRVSEARGIPVTAELDTGRLFVSFSRYNDLKVLSSQGTLTPDHVIRIKPSPMIMDAASPLMDVIEFAREYTHYFETHATEDLQMLDAAPRYAVWPGVGTVAFGTTPKETEIILDLAHHNQQAMLYGELMGGWTPVSKSDLFDLEYWELEQAKLKKGATRKPMQGKIALVTGAASGIGRATVEALVAQGAVVSAIDIAPMNFESEYVTEFNHDLRNPKSITHMVERTIKRYGGLDMVVSNAGMFPQTAKLEDMDLDAWNTSLQLNLTSHTFLLKEASHYLKWGIDPSVVIVGSKNVPAPGPGAAAYSAAKAGLTQVARIAAMELGEHGIPVNMVHPNQVFDTGIWNEEKIAERAQAYGLTAEQYMTNNMLKAQITSVDVANLIVTMLGPVFSKTTGAQIPIDGGNERVI